MIETSEMTHMECKYCSQDGKDEYHPIRHFIQGVVPNLQGVMVEVLWCTRQWSSYYRITNELIKAIPLDEKKVENCSENWKQAIKDIRLAANTVEGLLDVHLPPTIKAKEAFSWFQDAMALAKLSIQEFYKQEEPCTVDQSRLTEVEG